MVNLSDSCHPTDVVNLILNDPPQSTRQIFRNASITIHKNRLCSAELKTSQGSRAEGVKNSNVENKNYLYTMQINICSGNLFYDFLLTLANYLFYSFNSAICNCLFS